LTNDDDVAWCNCLKKSRQYEIEITPGAISIEQRDDTACKVIVETLLQSTQRPLWADIQSESEEAEVL
jgi:hypothetical protein